MGLNLDLSESGILVYGAPNKENGFVKQLKFENNQWIEKNQFNGNSEYNFFGNNVNVSSDGSFFSLTKTDNNNVSHVIYMVQMIILI